MAPGQGALLEWSAPKGWGSQRSYVATGMHFSLLIAETEPHIPVITRKGARSLRRKVDKRNACSKPKREAWCRAGGGLALFGEAPATSSFRESLEHKH